MTNQNQVSVKVSPDRRVVTITSAYVNSALHWQTIVGPLMVIPLIIAIVAGGYRHAFAILAFFGVALTVGRFMIHGKRDVVQASFGGIRYGWANQQGGVESWQKEWSIDEISQLRVNAAGNALLVITNDRKKMNIPLGKKRADVERAVGLLAMAMQGMPV